MSHPLGWAKAEILYDRLRLKEDLTQLQEALVLLVHLRKKAIRTREIEVIAIAGLREDNKSSVLGIMESYHNLVSPNNDKHKEKSQEEERAKEILAKETKKVFAVRPAKDPLAAARKMGEVPGLASVSRHFIKNNKVYAHKDMMNKAMSKKLR